MLAYRADIDGLRALANIFLAHFHNFPDFAEGGFIGVDIFFYSRFFLITNIITEELYRNKLSFMHFYERRIKKLFPALITTIFICLISIQIRRWS